MNLKTMWLGVLALWVTCSVPLKAVEGLQVSVQGTNVVLTWPSVDGDTYVIERSAGLTTNTNWICLSNTFPAASGTNITVFVDYGAVSNLNYGGGTNSGGSGGSPPTPGSGGSSTNQISTNANLLNFYEVVKVGVHLYGITNGMVLSGVVPLKVEFADTDTNTSLSFLFFDDLPDGTPSPLGVSFPTFIDSPPTNFLQGTWDTTQLPNGTYTIELGAQLSDYSTSDDHPVTVSNLVCWPNDTYWGGLGVYVGAQTVFTNGTWTLYIQDDAGNQYGPLTGDIDTNGWCNYTNVPGPGFTIDNTDGNGNQNPSSAYYLVLTVSTNGTTNIVITSTNLQLIEPDWTDISSDAVLGYMGLYDTEPDGLPFAALYGMVQAAWSTENAFHQEVLGTYETPYELNDTGSWSNLLQTLGGPGTFYNRDFFYFGHGNVDRIGANATVGLGLTAALVQTRLGTARIPMQGQLANRHPYRFVFLDGCLTSKQDDWCIAFGMPPKLTSNQVMLNHGARPRSFMGWKKTKSISIGAVSGDAFFNYDHANYVNGFFAGWAQRNSATGLGLLGVQDAITYANTYPNGNANITSGGMRLLGSADMIIDY